MGSSTPFKWRQFYTFFHLLLNLPPIRDSEAGDSEPCSGTEEVEWMIVPLSILVSLGCHW